MKHEKKQGWFSYLLDYASGSKGKLLCSTCLSVISVVSGLMPYFCMYRLVEHFVLGTAEVQMMHSHPPPGLRCYHVLQRLLYIILQRFCECVKVKSHHF